MTICNKHAYTNDPEILDILDCLGTGPWYEECYEYWI